MLEDKSEAFASPGLGCGFGEMILEVVGTPEYRNGSGKSVDLNLMPDDLLIVIKTQLIFIAENVLVLQSGSTPLIRVISLAPGKAGSLIKVDLHSSVVKVCLLFLLPFG